MSDKQNQTKEIEREYNDTIIGGKELPGEWVVEYIMETSTNYWLAVVRKKGAETHEDVHLTRHNKIERFQIGQKVKVLQSPNRLDFFASTPK